MQDAKSIYTANEVADKLKEIYGGLINAIQKGAISEQIKNKNYSGDATSGSVVIDRFKNAAIATYGTGRAAGKGTNLLNNGKVTINVDTDKEIIEEIENKDLKLGNATGLLEVRTGNHKERMIAELDRAFFTKAVAEGTAFEFSAGATTIAEKLEEIIQSVETTTNDWVDGVDRDMIVLSVKPSVYGAVRNYIDSVVNSTNGLSENMFHNVKIYANHRQTKDVIAMVNGAVGQLVTVDEYRFAPIELSNASAVSLFFSYGTKAVMPDLIKTADMTDVAQA